MNRFMELACCRALSHFTLCRRFYTGSADRLTIGRDRDSIGWRIHPFDPILPMTTGSFQVDY
jgi:hypothetical protein